MDHGTHIAGRDTEEGDARLLADVPETLCFGLMAKATGGEEAGRRFVYVEASDETVDAQGERVLCKALQESAQVFERYGNVDLDHITMLRERSGIAEWQGYEIGRPVAVRFDAGKTYVKAELYSGDTPLAKNANMVWDSLTRLRPPARWYASVGGTAGPKAVEVDPVTKARVPVIKSVRWVNLALSRTPVNQSVSVAKHVPFGVFAKSLNGFVVSKALEAGYGTDMAQLTGGAALREQSLDASIQSYWNFSERVAGALRKGECAATEAGIAAYAAEHFGIRHDKAVAWSGKFLADLNDAINTGNA